MRLILVVFSGLSLLAPALSAQEGERPANWNVRFDRSGTPDTAISFVTMSPGWHITTGPAAILYDPGRQAEGEFRARATIFLFDPGNRQREAFGVFIGGRDLEGPGQSYTYFLIRNTGDCLVKRRNGDATSTVRPWTPCDAMVRHPGGETNVKNEIVVEVRAETVDFILNGQKVATVPRSDIPVDGIVGLRVNHSLNLHVSELTVEALGG